MRQLSKNLRWVETVGITKYEPDLTNWKSLFLQVKPTVDFYLESYSKLHMSPTFITTHRVTSSTKKDNKKGHL